MNQPITTPKRRIFEKKLDFSAFLWYISLCNDNRDKLWQVKKKIKIMNLEETTKYKMARKGKIPVVKMEIGEEEILGYKGTITTEIYTHLSRPNLTKIKSLLASIYKEEQT